MGSDWARELQFPQDKVVRLREKSDAREQNGNGKAARDSASSYKWP